jgi:hypothetical protein
MPQQEMIAVPSKRKDSASRTLTLEDLMDVSSNAYTYLEVKQVLPRVEELAQTAWIKSELKRPGAVAVSKARAAGTGPHNETTTGNHVESEMHLSLGEENGAVDAMVVEKAIADASFVEWKREILREARARARSTDPTCSSDAHALALAADTVLLKYGLPLG